jgi:transcription antitermination factor NusG
MHSAGDGVEELAAGSPLAWYAIYTKHQHEKNAANILSKKGFDVLLPLFRSTHRWKDRSQVVQLPLFPCYVFLQASLERKSEVLRTPGVFWFVGNGGRTCAIPYGEIDAIRRATRGPAKFEPHPYLKSGDRVRIRSGALAGVEGFLTRIKNEFRVVLSVELLQKAVAVEVDFSIVEPVVRGERPSAASGLESERMP